MVIDRFYCACVPRQSYDLSLDPSKADLINDPRLHKILFKDERFIYTYLIDAYAYNVYKKYGKDVFVFFQMKRYEDTIQIQDWFNSYLRWNRRNEIESMDAETWYLNTWKQELNFKYPLMNEEHCLLWGVQSHNSTVSRGKQVWAKEKQKRVETIDKCVNFMDKMKHESAMLDLINQQTLLSVFVFILVIIIFYLYDI